MKKRFLSLALLNLVWLLKTSQGLLFVGMGMLLFVSGCENSCERLQCQGFMKCNEEFDYCECDCGEGGTCVNGGMACNCRTGFAKDNSGRCTINLANILGTTWSVKDSSENGVVYYKMKVKLLDNNNNMAVMEPFQNITCVGGTKMQVNVNFNIWNNTNISLNPLNSSCSNYQAYFYSSGSDDGITSSWYYYMYDYALNTNIAHIIWLKKVN